MASSPVSIISRHLLHFVHQKQHIKGNNNIKGYFRNVKSVTYSCNVATSISHTYHQRPDKRGHQPQSIEDMTHYVSTGTCIVFVGISLHEKKLIINEYQDCIK